MGDIINVNIDRSLYERLKLIGVIAPEDVRGYNVGASDYAEGESVIQPWSYIRDHNLDYMDGDIIKRVTRRKTEPGMTENESRILDYKKIKHICDEQIRYLSCYESIMNQSNTSSTDDKFNFSESNRK